MSDHLTIPLQGLTDADVKPIRQAIQRAKRNRRIRARYKELRPEIGQIQAIDQIAEEFDLHPGHVRRILYGH